MEEALENEQGISFLTLFKAICKKWLLIGFLAVFGGLMACVYAFAAMPLTKDVYQSSIFLNQTNLGTEKSVIFYNDQNIANIRTYLSGSEYKKNVFSALDERNEIFTDISDAGKRETKFKNNITVTVGHSATIYVMNQDEAAAKIILREFFNKAQDFVEKMMSDMREKAVEAEIPFADIVGITAVSGNVVKTDPKEADIQGHISTMDRLTTVVIGAVVGIIAGAAAAVCIYYFNGRLNSVQTLNSMGVKQVYVDKKSKNGMTSVYDENAARYNFVIEKQGGKIITFISPEKTDETNRALQAHAESMRKYGYRVAETGQGNQTHEEWKEILASKVSENDFVLVDAAPSYNFDCAVPGALSDGVTLIVDQKNTRLKQLRHVKEIIETAKLKAVSAVIVNTREDFII